MRIIYGINSVSEALKSSAKISKIVTSSNQNNSAISEIMEMVMDKNIQVEKVSKSKIDGLTNGNNHQNILAYAEEFAYSSVSEILENAKIKNEKPFILILDGITDVHNLGAIIRSAECAGIHGIIIPDRRSAKVNETVTKISAGSVEHIKIASVVNLTNTIKILKKEGLWIYGASANEQKKYYEEKYDIPLALVIGSEGKGISRLIKENCDEIIEIPMKGYVNSLNASCAAAILIFEIIRQRSFN